MTTPPQPAPSPKSPPRYPDFCGRHRLQAEVQILNREIGFLEEELQSLDDLQPASRSCKEVNEFVGANPDPLIPINRGKSESCCIWRWFGKKLCAGLSWICCCGRSSKAKGSSCSCAPPKDGASCGGWCSTCARPEDCCSCCSCSCTLPKEDCCCGICCACGEACRRFWSCAPLRRWSCCGLRQCRCRCRRWCLCRSFPSCRPCPEYSCGCVWSCPSCNGIRLCARFSKPCCVSRCLCP
ncbi:unnamed protein product [Spirodela intermedia]|uniref:G protein gamma domain-containing protein n=1 Tax=Spirodela intermedia TaxID=51605 RepID=A0A7I8KCW9_SPIIN|nr:unnamed protein product [Spirodela intermedia]